MGSVLVAMPDSVHRVRLRLRLRLRLRARLEVRVKVRIRVKVEVRIVSVGRIPTSCSTERCRIVIYGIHKLN